MKILKIGNSLIFGVEHYNMNDVKKVFNYVKKSYRPEDRVVFMGEGGDDNNVYEKGSEQEEIKNKLENYFTNFINDSWDGKETNVLNPNSNLFKEISLRSGLSRDKTIAAVYVIIVGQTRRPEEMNGLLTKEGENWIKSFDIKNPKNPSNEDMDLMYDLCFPQDSNKPETEMSKITDIFNKVRDENLLKKIKNYHKNGYMVIATVGEGHIDLLKNIKTKESDVNEKWSEKYKKSIDCNNPKGFSQRAHCQGKKKKMNETEILKGGLADNKTLIQLAKKHDAKGYYHIQDMVKSLKKQLEMGMKVEMEHTDSKEKAKEIAMDHLWEDPSYYTKLKKVEAKETDSSSSGAYSAPLFGKTDVIKRPISKIPNMDLSEQESEVGEATLSSSAGAFDVPAFGKTTNGGRKNPLKIDGKGSEYKGRAVKDKNFPKWGGPDSVFVKVKEKCKKFPYCNQGNTGAIEFIKEDKELQEAIQSVSRKYGISHDKVEEIVLNEIKQIFI